MRAPGRLSQAALFLVDNKSRSKRLALQVPLAARLPPQPSDQGLCALPLPRRSADVHHRGSREPRGSVRISSFQPGDERLRNLNLEGVGVLVPGLSQQVKTDPSP